MFEKLFKGQRNGGLKMKENNLKKNGSGYFDMVAYAAMKEAEMKKNLKKFDEPMTTEERKKREVYLRNRCENKLYVRDKEDVYRFHRLLDSLKEMSDLAGFDVVGHIVLKDRKTGKVWR